mgnify:FL=1
MIKMFPNINNMKIYLVCGKTDLRKGIDGLAALVTEAFSLDDYDNAIFLFCGTLSDRSLLNSSKYQKYLHLVSRCHRAIPQILL